ncbi:hypothetical protein MHY01S_20880 [Meiothermus hypogaeus NBRC 106114]|uniref:Uncharacterized protein n=2 Tax=Meiothermus hypogaeus TaxID=884155 RepID=A0A511R4V2_9DEIN|nr:hypothetical protein Mhypo_03269 [Meiothermus hypogaeus]GEM83922.1 hypothetical protein MHY01S_20880 [Meiothermus hypogaeus NBRC 106114]
MMDLHPYAGLAACNPCRTARFRRAGLLISLTYMTSGRWEAKVWGPNGVSPGQLEGIAKALHLDSYAVSSYLAADFKTYVFVISGSRDIVPELKVEYDELTQRLDTFTPIPRV